MSKELYLREMLIDRQWRINEYGEIELYVSNPFGHGNFWCRLRSICLWCFAVTDECGTDCPGTSEEEYEQYARWLLEGVPMPDDHPIVELAKFYRIEEW
jgi:hypothetical protein